jgi:hypothetical protein
MGRILDIGLSGSPHLGQRHLLTDTPEYSCLPDEKNSDQVAKNELSMSRSISGNP